MAKIWVVVYGEIKMSVLTKNEVFEIFIQHKNEILNFGTKKLGLFGSYVRNESTIDSDLDVVVEFEKGKKNYDNFINLAYYLEDLVKIKVELVTVESLSPYIKGFIQKEVEYVNFSS